VKFKLTEYRFLKSKVLFGVFCCTILFACTQAEIINLGQSKIRIINVTPENNSLSFFVNDTLKTPQALSFSEGTGYLNTSAGTNQVFTKVSGNEVNHSRTNFFFNSKNYYTIFISGKISKDSLIYISTEDKLTAPTSNKAKVRLVNVSPNSTSLEAVFSTQLIDSIANFSNINFRASSNYFEFTPGNYIIKVRKAGQKTALVNGANFNISPGKIYTIYVKGLLNGTGSFNLSAGMLTDN
jgi:hypothetical protein